MPVKSDAQRRFMYASLAGKTDVPPSVAKKFVGPKAHAEGGSMKNAMMKKVFAGKETPAEERKEKTAAKKAGMTYKAAERKFEGEKYARGGGIESKGKTKGKIVKMAMGGKAC
jgi:hypothetical protein